MSDIDMTHSVVRTYIIKRSKQRFERLGVLRYILRILMLLSRICTVKQLKLDPITFGILGWLENIIGLLKMFNIRKQTIKLEKFSKDR